VRLGRAVQYIPFVGFDGNEKIKAGVDKSARSGAEAVYVEEIRAWFDGERLYALYRLCKEAML